MSESRPAGSPAGSLQQDRVAKLILELRQGGISDMRVLNAMERTPREDFVPVELAHQAYENHALPIERGQTISQPFVVAYMTQALDVQDRMRVLEIGTGSGYQAAILAKLCRRIYTVERHAALLRQAEPRFRKLRLDNVTIRLGDGYKGWPEQAPFQRIIVTAVAPEVPPALLEQLAEDGVMVVPVGEDPLDQKLVRVTKHNGRLDYEDMIGVRFVPLLEGVASDRD